MFVKLLFFYLSPFCVIRYVDLYFDEDRSNIAMDVIINDIVFKEMRTENEDL